MNEEQINELLPSKLSQINETNLTNYLSFFQEIQKYKLIKQGKMLINLFEKTQDDNIARNIFKKVCMFFQFASPQGKVCTLQFVKELIELGHLQIFLEAEHFFKKVFTAVINFRKTVKSMNRGSNFFVQKISKQCDEERVFELIKLSNTYFKMVHECLYIWGMQYFPKSKFSLLYENLCKECVFPSYPDEFKFFFKNKVQRNKEKVEKIRKYLSEREDRMDVSPRTDTYSNEQSKVIAISKQNKQVKKVKQQQQSKPNQNEQKQKSKSIQNINPQSKVIENKKNDIRLKKVNLKQQVEEKDDEQSVEDVEDNIEVNENDEEENESKRIQREMLGERVNYNKSKIVQKPKNKPPKIPKNIIYRQSSIQNPQDLTKEISTKQKFTLKVEKSIQIPMATIKEASKQSSSYQPKSINSITPISSQRLAYETITEQEQFQSQISKEDISKGKSIQQSNIKATSQREKIRKEEVKQNIGGKIEGKISNLEQHSFKKESKKQINQTKQIKQKSNIIMVQNIENLEEEFQQVSNIFQKNKLQTVQNQNKKNIQQPKKQSNSNQQIIPSKKSLNVSTTKSNQSKEHQKNAVSQKVKQIQQPTITKQQIEKRTINKQKQQKITKTFQSDNKSKSPQQGQQRIKLEKRSLTEDKMNKSIGPISQNKVTIAQNMKKQGQNERAQEIKDNFDSKDKRKKWLKYKTNKKKIFDQEEKEQQNLTKCSTQKINKNLVISPSFEFKCYEGRNPKKQFRKFREFSYSYLPENEELLKKQQENYEKIQQFLNEGIEKINNQNQKKHSILKKMLKTTKHSFMKNIENEQLYKQKIACLENQIKIKKSQQLSRKTGRSASGENSFRRRRSQQFQQQFAPNTMLYILSKKRSILI